MNFLKKTAIVLGVAALATAASVHAENNIKIYVDNDEVKSEKTPVIIDGRTFVPVRAVFEKAGAEVEWVEEIKTAKITKDNYEVAIALNESFLLKNGEPVALDVPATIVDGSLFIPVRAISEAMDFGVTWNAVKSYVLISTTGDEYRACQWGRGFLPLNDAGFYVTGQLNDIPYFDLNNDGLNEALAFIPSQIQEDGTRNTPALWIDGQSFNHVLDTEMLPYGIAVVDVINSDEYTELIVFYNSDDGNCAGVYRYDGAEVTHVKANNTENGMIYFNSNLFFDGTENIISDKDGLCFLNTMVCTGTYSLENGEVCRYRLNPSTAEGFNLIREHSDNYPYSIKEVTLYEKGKYVDSAGDNEIIYSNNIAGLKILDCYLDENDPSRFEFFVEFPDGTTAVIWPYFV